MNVRSEVYFAMVPEWVLDAEISDKAVRLYGVLNRFAGKSQRARPRRSTLALRLRCSKSTVDRMVKELVDIGAVEVRYRLNERGDQTSNEYFLFVTPRRMVAATPPSREERNRRSAAQGTFLEGEGGRTGAAPSPEEDGATRENDDEVAASMTTGGGRVDEERVAASVRPRTRATEREKNKTPATPRPSREGDEIWQALTAIFDEPRTPSQTRLRGKHVKELRLAKATPDEIKRQVRLYRNRFRNAELTEPALVKWFGQLSAPSAGATPASDVLRCSHGYPISYDDENNHPFSNCTECDTDTLHARLQAVAS